MADFRPPFSAQDALSTERLKSEYRVDPASDVRRDGTHVLIDHVPGAPDVDLSPSSVYNFLVDEFATPILDQLHPHLWFVGKRDSNNIDPLHLQKIKGREIVPAEDTGLHLLWENDKIYIKPLPEFLLNHDFWRTYLSSDAPNPPTSKLADTQNPNFSSSFPRSIALGFLRTYAHLIHHRSDFLIARSLGLIPADLPFSSWSKTISPLRSIPDHSVSPRYHYGQLRLTRLHWAVRLWHPRSAPAWFFYHLPHWSFGAYIDAYLSPFIFLFGSLSLILSAMQVLLAVPRENLGWEFNPSAMVREYRACWSFAVIMLSFSAWVWLMLLVLPSVAWLWQFCFGVKEKGRLRRERVTRDMGGRGEGGV